MAAPFIVSIPHKLGKDEAVRRLKAGLGSVKNQYGQMLKEKFPSTGSGHAGESGMDMVLLGMGDDGHTASLFPGTPVLEVTDRIAAEVFVPRMNQWRVTITLPVIRAAGLRMVLAAGESKRPILEDVRRGVDHPIVRATADLESWWFVDRAAAPVENP